MGILTLLAFLAASLLSAAVLVLVFRQDEMLQRNFDHEEFWFRPGPIRAVGIVRTAIAHAAFAALLGFITIQIWHLYGPFLPLPEFPAHSREFKRVMDSPELTHRLLSSPRLMATTPVVHLAAIGWLAVFFARTAWRCLGGKAYDIFISYKSEDAPFARRIADALTAAGWRVWFAEYRIVLRWRAYFLAMFMNGIRNSRFGLAITNDRWASSKHCAIEAQQMLGWLGPEAMIELAAPREPAPHGRFPELAQAAQLETRDLDTILAFIEKKTEQPVPRSAYPPTVAAGALYRGGFHGRPCSIELAGWNIENLGDGSLSAINWHYAGLPHGKLSGYLDASTIDPAKLEKGLRFGLEERLMFDVLAHYALKGMKQAPRVLQPKSIDEAVRMAADFKDVKRLERPKARGAHLLFHGGRPQMALTHWPGAHKDHWRRTVLLDVQNPVTRAASSLQFFFYFRGSFQEYCRHAHVMDALALSFEWS
jgi:hypothetical protein